MVDQQNHGESACPAAAPSDERSSRDGSRSANCALLPVLSRDSLLQALQRQTEALQKQTEALQTLNERILGLLGQTASLIELVLDGEEEESGNDTYLDGTPVR